MKKFLHSNKSFELKNSEDTMTSKPALNVWVINQYLLKENFKKLFTCPIFYAKSEDNISIIFFHHQ